MLQPVFILRVKTPQLTDERECRKIFTAVGNLGELVLEEADVRLESVALSYFDGDEVVVIILGLPTGGVLGDECLCYLLEIVERTRWQRVKPIRDHTFQIGRKGQMQ